MVTFVRKKAQVSLLKYTVNIFSKSMHKHISLYKRSHILFLDKLLICCVQQNRSSQKYFAYILWTFILIYRSVYLKKGKVGKKRLLQIPSFRSINIFRRTVYRQVGEMGFAWVPQIGLIVLFKLDFFVLQQYFTTNQLHQKRQTSKSYWTFVSVHKRPNLTPIPPPQITLHNHHNSRTSNIPIITLWCLCKSKSTNKDNSNPIRENQQCPLKNKSAILCL